MSSVLTIVFITSTFLGFYWLVTVAQLYKLSGRQEAFDLNEGASQGGNFISAFFSILGIKSPLNTLEPINKQVIKMRWVLIAFTLTFGFTMVGLISKFSAV